MTGVTAEPTVDHEHPWPGLVAFTEEARNYFYGREVEEDELVRRIRRGTTLLFFGQSGLGKTSLLQAGLAPRLRDAGMVPILIRLSYDSDAGTPSSQLRRLFAQALAAANPPMPPIAAGETLWEYLHRRAPVDVQGDAMAQEALPPPVPVFMFDQFEEVFNLGLGRPAARGPTQDFLIELSDLIENRCPADVRARIEQSPALMERLNFARADYRIVITMREDFLPRAESLRSRAPSLGRDRYRLTRMSGIEALEAVRCPGEGLIENDVAEQIVRLVGGHRPDDPFGREREDGPPALAELEVEPSLLSLFCSELNERRLKARLDKITLNAVMGDRDEILQNFYDRSFRRLPSRLRKFVERDLVTESGVRESVAIERARQILGKKRRQVKGLDELVRRRLLHVEERFAVPRIELIHDLLAKPAMRSRRRRLVRKRWVWGLIWGVLIIPFTTLFVAGTIIAIRDDQDKTAIASVIGCDENGTADACNQPEAIDDGALQSLSSRRAKILIGQMNKLALSEARNGSAYSIKMYQKIITMVSVRPDMRYDLADVYNSIAIWCKNNEMPDRAISFSRISSEISRKEIDEIRNKGNGDKYKLKDFLEIVRMNDDIIAFISGASAKAALAEIVSVRTQQLELVERPTESGGIDNAAIVGALGNRAFAFVEDGRPMEAIADADRALRRDPTQNWIKGNKADALIALGRYPEAAALFREIADRPEEGFSKSGRGTPKMCRAIVDDMDRLERLGVVDGRSADRVRAEFKCKDE